MVLCYRGRGPVPSIQLCLLCRLPRMKDFIMAGGPRRIDQVRSCSTSAASRIKYPSGMPHAKAHCPMAVIKTLGMVDDSNKGQPKTKRRSSAACIACMPRHIWQICCSLLLLCRRIEHVPYACEPVQCSALLLGTCKGGGRMKFVLAASMADRVQQFVCSRS